MNKKALLGQWFEIYRQENIFQSGWGDTKVHLGFDDKLLIHISFKHKETNIGSELNFTATSDSSQINWSVNVLGPISASLNIVSFGKLVNGICPFMVVEFYGQHWVLARNQWLTQDQIRELTAGLESINLDLKSFTKVA